MEMLIQRHQKVYENTKEMKQLQTLTMKLMIFILITIIVFHSNLSRKLQEKQEMVA